MLRFGLTPETALNAVTLGDLQRACLLLGLATQTTETKENPDIPANYVGYMGGLRNMARLLDQIPLADKALSEPTGQLVGDLRRRLGAIIVAIGPLLVAIVDPEHDKILAVERMAVTALVESRTILPFVADIIRLELLRPHVNEDADTAGRTGDIRKGQENGDRTILLERAIWVAINMWAIGSRTAIQYSSDCGLFASIVTLLHCRLNDLLLHPSAGSQAMLLVSVGPRTVKSKSRVRWDRTVVTFSRLELITHLIWAVSNATSDREIAAVRSGYAGNLLRIGIWQFLAVFLAPADHSRSLNTVEFRHWELESTPDTKSLDNNKNNDGQRLNDGLLRISAALLVLFPPRVVKGTVDADQRLPISVFDSWFDILANILRSENGSVQASYLDLLNQILFAWTSITREKHFTRRW